MFGWLNGVGCEDDIAALREEYPEISTLEQYFRASIAELGRV